MAYTPLRIRTVKPSRELTFDLFIFFKDQYIIYANRGSEIEEEKYGKLKKQKIAKFYIDESDEMNYQKFLDALLNETMNSETATTEEKVNLVEGVCGTAVERMQKDPESETSYKMTENAARSLRQCISDNPEALKEIFGKKVEEEDLLIKHSLNVSALSMKLGQKMNLSEEELDEIAVAGLLHDIGLMQMDQEARDLFKKNRKDLKPDERLLYGAHVKDCMAVLAEKPYVNKKTMNLILNHEEVKSGDGPNKKTQLSQSEYILSLVNIYDKMCITTEMTPKEVIKEILIEELGNFELDLLNKFKGVLTEEGLLDL
ncbi:HD-GYP domain-containing protein [Halobacteriovorax sp. HLS]|uniref:HD-GYP domain-containing protein n=1 Tax=Halobacteriovorax sp. HLS TaxID=2234000 RepID=UPI000FD9B387|nr:HD domain-containing phosphohydrolase [Halobacteriovorax sp. HLS]